MPLPQDLQTPTSEALLVAGVQFHTQVSVGRAFKAAVKEDPSFSQCKPEETRIISELIPSLSSLFSTLGELSDFLSQQRKQEDVVTRVVAAPPAADARPTLEEVMATFAAAPPRSAEVLVRLPVYLPARVASSFSKGGPQALQMLDYTYTLMQPFYSRELGSKASTRHLLDVTEDAESWVARNIAACGSAACTAQQAGDRGLSVSIENASPETAAYTFPATREERAASSVFSWLLPGLPPLRCKLPVSVKQQPIIPVLLPPIVPPPMGAPTGEGPPMPEAEEGFPPTAEEAAEERASGEKPPETVEQVQPATPEKLPEEPIKLERLPADPDVTDPEELITARPKEAEEGPQLDPKDDACHTLMRLYYKYIEGKEVKDVETLFEEAMQQARKKVKTDAAAAALCAALRFAEFLRQITKQGEGFDRTLSLWHLSLPTDSLRLVNAMRTAAKQKDVLSQELCTLAPPSSQVQQLLTRFDPQQWAALAMQAETPEELPAPEEARSSEA
ncbi:hypothetical protein Emag_002237 [Eimeria magna]